MSMRPRRFCARRWDSGADQGDAGRVCCVASGSDLKENGELPKRVRVRSSKYSIDLIESENQAAAEADVGAEELRNGESGNRRDRTGEKIKKGQFKMGKLGGPTATMPEIWRAALAA